ncbi:S1 RNA-binding domain-containing protein [Bremerella sp. JC817]|uniref:30S ribosomal protein S1 n=1 Tax=Bremerella sp. JC817 TaxID=3231756 RepID=UPI0034585F18
MTNHPDNHWQRDLLGADNSVDVNQIVEGQVVRVEGEVVFVDVGAKSAGSLPRAAWGDDVPRVGQTVIVVVEQVDGDQVRLEPLLLSKRSTPKTVTWEEIVDSFSIGQIVQGTVVRRIQGGLIVDIGANAFLPETELDTEPSPELENFIGRDLECEILQIDHDRRILVLSRRQLLQQQPAAPNEALLQALAEGQVRRGIIHRITNYGAFVDLGGLTGLLLITNMSWDRIRHPSDLVSIGDEVEVVILRIDQATNQISVGLKQLSPDPWENIEDRFPIGSTATGTVYQQMTYGTFIELAPTIIGLIPNEGPSNETLPIADLDLNTQVTVEVISIDKTARKMLLKLAEGRAGE